MKKAGGIKDSQTVSYSANLKPDTPSKTEVQVQDIVEYAYDKSKNLFFFVTDKDYFSMNHADKPLSALGCKLFFIKERHDHLNELQQLSFIKRQTKGQSYYFYNEIRKKLYYAYDNEIEAVPIQNQTLFEKNLKELCYPYEYDIKFLKNETIATLITNNGGHEPVRSTSHENPQQYSSAACAKINSTALFYKRLRNARFKLHPVKSASFERLMEYSKHIEEAESIKHNFPVYDEDDDVYYLMKPTPMHNKLGLFKNKQQLKEDVAVEEEHLAERKL